MNKNEVIQLINSDVFEITTALNTLYHNKTFVVVKGNRIEKFFKTKRGAEGYIKKQKNNSWYDEMTFEMWSPGDGMEFFEILDNDIASIEDIKVWYKDIRANQRHIEGYSMYSNYITLAETTCTTKEIINYVKESMETIKQGNFIQKIEAYEEKEIIQDEQQTTDSTVQNTTPASEEESKKEEVTVKLNEEKNGVEVYFSSKPSVDTILNLKMNGFRWSKYNKCWYAKQSNDTINFANNLTSNNSQEENNSNEATTEIQNSSNETICTINIDDIETYTVDAELSKRENSVSMFRTKDRDHTAELQSVLQQANDSVIELCNHPFIDSYTEYNIKRSLQSFKKKYCKSFISILQHKANNPSWTVTGRGGLNINRYNKKQEQYTNKLKENSNLIDEFNAKLDRYKSKLNKLKKEHDKNILEQQKNSMPNQKFIKEKIKINIGAVHNIFADAKSEVNAYTLLNNKDYYIINSWARWRIYNKMGNEVAQDKTLTEAKKLLLVLISNQEQKTA